MLKTVIYTLREKENLSQEKLAEILGVSRQAVQKWETGVSVPELSKIIEISKYFGISLDTMLLGRTRRIVVDELKYKDIKPLYKNIHDWEFYASGIMDEYKQSTDEGLDIEQYKNVFEAVDKLPKDEIKNDLANVLQKIVINADIKKCYKYKEPSELTEIKALRKEYSITKKDPKNLEDKIYGAWMGRICGCMLGKSVEGVRSDELIPFLKETNNFPLHRYIFKSDITKEIAKKYNYDFMSRCYADEIDGMPIDDDTNYTVLSQLIVDNYGRTFTPDNISKMWLKCQPKDAYCTAERVAFCNFVKGYMPPESAVHKNPYREWIGARIRGDYWGYINPGNPELAAEMAWRDASISHVKNGIYGEMFAAAMIATAAVTNVLEEIILSGISQIPCTSRLYDSITKILDYYKDGKSKKEVFEYIYDQYDEKSSYGWCHTIPNDMIVVASLLYGNGDFAKSICMAVESAFDTDCNGATVGSILGMANGIKSIPPEWASPMNDTLHTSIFGVGTLKISDAAKKTMTHISNQN